jgi:hypothetical protein
MKQNQSDSSVSHYPRQEIAIVEQFVREHDGEFTLLRMRERLSGKMDPSIFERATDFLIYRKKISVDMTGKVHRNASPDQPGKVHWSTREEANAITCFAFRNGFIEELHAGKHSELLENSELSRITDEEMKKLMSEASQKMAELLAMKETDPGKYWRLIADYNQTYCKQWAK